MPEQLVERGLAFLRAAVEREAEEARARDVGQAVGAAGDLVPVEQDDADDLAEAQRDDGQVVAAQAQDGKAQHDAEARGEQAGQRQAGPEAQPEGLREQGVGVGADGVEGDVAEVEQAGEADHDVQAPAEHDVDQDGGGDVDDVAVGERQERQHQGEHQARRRRTTRSARRCVLAEPGPGPAACDGPLRRRRSQLRASRPANTIAVSRNTHSKWNSRVMPVGAAGRAHAEHRRQQDEGDEGGEQRVLQRRDHAGSGAVRRWRRWCAMPPRPSRSRACPAGPWAGRSGPRPGCRTRPRPCTGC